MPKKTDATDAPTRWTVPVVPPAEHPELAALAAARLEQAAPVPQLLALDAFVRFVFGGKNFDQSAGFVRWAQKQSLTRQTHAQWTSHLETFQNRRIGG